MGLSMSAYFYFIKVRILISLAYRFEALSSILVQFVILSINAYFWRAVYGSRDVVQDVDLYQMLTFSVISTLLGCFFVHTVEGKMHSKIRDGSVAQDYIKPISLFGMFLAEDMGEIVVNITQRFIPVIIFASIFIVIPMPASWLHFLFFAVSVFFSFFILWFIAAIFGLLNIWLIDLGPISGAKNTVILFLSGSIVPVWFYPESIQRVLAFTPFIYTYQTPIGIFIGRTSIESAFAEIGVQVFWCLLFFSLFIFVKSKALKNVMVQGG